MVNSNDLLITRRVDSQNRIVIPAAALRLLNMKQGDAFQFTVDSENKCLILKKYSIDESRLNDTKIMLEYALDSIKEFIKDSDDSVSVEALKVINIAKEISKAYSSISEVIYHNESK